MTSYYKSIYTSLRSAMIDRDMGDDPNDAVVIDFVSAQVALKPEVPSAALLISYSMLFYPNWLADADPSIGKPPMGKTVEEFMGGVNNPGFPLLFNPELTMIATAIGIHAGLWTIHYSNVLGTVFINPNMENPLVLKTREMILENGLNFTNARDVFIELMQQEKYVGNIRLEDDYIANATFIPEAQASVDEIPDYAKEAMSVDLSGEFKGAKHNG